MEASNISHNPSDQDVILFICSPTQSKHVEWTFQEDRVFEKALALHDPNSSDFFENIATKIPDKTVQQIKDHFEVLVEDIKLIEGNCFSSRNCITAKKNEWRTPSNGHMTSIHQQTKKGARWTKEEHEKFLIGLNRFGKGDWRNISRNCVLTKTPTQVASHAQKYFIRLEKSSNPQKYTTSQDTSMVRASSSQSLVPKVSTNTKQHSI